MKSNYNKTQFKLIKDKNLNNIISNTHYKYEDNDKDKEFKKDKWERFKTVTNKVFYDKLIEITNQQANLKEIFNRKIPYDTLYFCDFETTTKHSKTFKEYYQQTGRTKSIVHYFFLLRSDFFKQENIGKMYDDNGYNLIKEGTTIDDIFEMIKNDKRERDNYKILFHNIAFDGKYIIDYLIQQNIPLKNEKGIDNKELLKAIKNNADEKLKEPFYYVNTTKGKISSITIN